MKGEMNRARVIKNQESMDAFGARLRALRTERNLSQKDLAAMAQVHFIQYGRYERGLARPTTDVLRRLAKALEVSGDYLLEGNSSAAAKADFEDRELLQLFQEVEHFPEDDKSAIKKMLEAFVIKRKVQSLAIR